MDDLKTAVFSSFLLCAGFFFTLAQADLEFISPTQQAELAKEFETAEFSNKNQDNLREKSWTCDMYGVRSRMQVQRGLKLYKWDETWRNKGAQLVREYKPEKQALVGKSERFQDQVRLTSGGRLISQLSLNSPEHRVVAYSVCSAE